MKPVRATGGILFAVQLARVVRRSEVAGIVGNVAPALFVLLLSGVLLMNVIRFGRVTANRIVGAIGVYLLFVVELALPFNLAERLSRGAFLVGPSPSNCSFWRSHYLPVITLCSLGLSDLVPMQPFARSLVTPGGDRRSGLHDRTPAPPRPVAKLSAGRRLVKAEFAGRVWRKACLRRRADATCTGRAGARGADQSAQHVANGRGAT
jgi:hypothetical protein